MEEAQLPKVGVDQGQNVGQDQAENQGHQGHNEARHYR